MSMKDIIWYAVDWVLFVCLGVIGVVLGRVVWDAYQAHEEPYFIGTVAFVSLTNVAAAVRLLCVGGHWR